MRRLAPDCSKIELGDLSQEHDLAKLLHAMGWETANVHLGSATAHGLLLDLTSRPDDWLEEAVGVMGREVRSEWEEWRETSLSDLPKA